MIKPVIVCIAKFEQDYIEEFVRYHLHLGFDKIYLYDNEDVPIYGQILRNFGDNVVVTHLPGKNYSTPPQYQAFSHFVTNYMYYTDLTHVCHIDIDEFIVLKKHNNIKEFIKEYIYDGENNIMCGGICMNWRFFGSSNKTENTKEPVTQRFTKCEEKGNLHVKSIFSKNFYGSFPNPHYIFVNNTNYPLRTTTGKIMNGPYNEDIDFSVVQVNHYKSKTLGEFKYIRTRGRADLHVNPLEDVVADFNLYDKNEIDNFDAYHFYKNVLKSNTINKFEKDEKDELGTLDSYLEKSECSGFEGHSQQIPTQTTLLKSYTSRSNVKTVLEIGFSAGHSSDTFLKSKDNVSVTSFDLGHHNYVIYGKSYIDQKYPERHRLFIGDSRETIPAFIKITDTKYDVIFIDGGHEYEVSYSDLINCKQLAHKDTIVIMDDVTNAANESYNRGPSQAWKDAIAQNIVVQEDHFEFNRWRGMSTGKYLF